MRFDHQRIELTGDERVHDDGRDINNVYARLTLMTALVARGIDLASRGVGFG
jgi:hypothetical protein